jgi:hypothetical protein
MRHIRVATSIAALAVISPAMPAAAQTAPAPAAVALPVPVMSGPLALSAVPPSLNAGAFGIWYIDGAATGLGLAQSHPFAGDAPAAADIGNGEIFVQKIDGWFRAYLQIGAYALPTLGQTYAHQNTAADTWQKLYGAAPQAFVKFAPSDAFSLQAGKLPSLIGGEYSFTFENINIERGLLWAQEPAVSRGIQANIIRDSLAFSVSLNDGYYANRFTWVTGSASWTMNGASTLVAAGGGNFSHTNKNTPATPLAQNNGTIYNLIYTYTRGPWIVAPYLQYNNTPAHRSLEIAKGANLADSSLANAGLTGAAMLVSYAVDKHVSLGLRLEEEITTGGGHQTVNLLYGPGSGATSLTLTPCFTRGPWFLRPELSGVLISRGNLGDGFGHSGRSAWQGRALAEGGYIF